MEPRKEDAALQKNGGDVDDGSGAVDEKRHSPLSLIHDTGMCVLQSPPYDSDQIDVDSSDSPQPVRPDLETDDSETEGLTDPLPTAAREAQPHLSSVDSVKLAGLEEGENEKAPLAFDSKRQSETTITASEHQCSPTALAIDTQTVQRPVRKSIRGK